MEVDPTMSLNISLVHRISCGAIAVQAILACCQPAFAEGVSTASSIPAVSAEQGLGERFDVTDLQQLDAAVNSAPHASASVRPASREIQSVAAASDDIFTYTRHATPLLAGPSLDQDKPLRPMSGLAVGLSPAYSRSTFFNTSVSAR